MTIANTCPVFGSPETLANAYPCPFIEVIRLLGICDAKFGGIGSPEWKTSLDFRISMI